MSIPPPYASASLYVGDLATDVTEAVLFEIFNAVGPVASVRVCRDAATRRSLGYAYVNFHRVEDAERALDTLNFAPIRGRACRIMWSHRDPSLRKSGLGNIFVKNLASTIDNKALYDTFSIFGNILSCKVVTNNKGESLGYGFVHYETEEAASSAIGKVNNHMIAGQVVTVSAFRSRKERDGGKLKFTNVYIKNIPTDFDENQLREMFGRHGTITSCMIGVDKNGQSLGFGFVNFSTPDAAARACEIENDKDLRGDGKKLFVVRAQKRDEREKELKERFALLKAERQRTFAGVNLYIKNLSDQIDDEKLRDEFSKFGVIKSAHVMLDQAGKSRGFGFVCLSSQDEASRAVTEMNGKMVDSKPLYVALAQRKDVRRQQLEAQYAARVKAGPGQTHMYPGPGPQVGYFPGPQRAFYQPMVRTQWVPAQAPGVPSAPYQLMPIRGRGGAAAGRGGAGVRTPRGAKVQVAGAAQPQAPGARSSQAQADRLTPEDLASASEPIRKQMIGERLYPLIKALQPENAGKITGMLLEMDNGELLELLENTNALKDKVDEAVVVLQEYAAQEANPSQ